MAVAKPRTSAAVSPLARSATSSAAAMAGGRFSSVSARISVARIGLGQIPAGQQLLEQSP